MRLRILLALVCLSLMSLPAAAALDVPYTRKVLDNGLTVIVHEDPKAPVVAVNTWYHVGSKNESPGRTGFAHLFEHLMFQGSENFDGEYLSYLQELGATDLNATTWFDRTIYFQTVPKNSLDTVLWLESDRMGHFAGSISQAKLDEQRGVVQNEKRQGENQPYGRVFEQVLPKLFPDGHPYAWETIGSMEDLNAATLDDVRDWFSTWYGPDNAVIAIAGDVDTAEVIAKVERYFGDIPPGPVLTRPTRWIPTHAEERRLTMTDRVPQTRVYFSWTGPAWGTTDAHHLALAANILGGGKNSRLYERLVYDEALATEAALAPLALEIAGITYLVASAQPGVPIAQVEAAAREELERFVRRGPTRRELERAKVEFRAAFLRGIERVGGGSGKSAVLAQGQVYGGAPDSYQKELADVEAATAADLQAVATRWLQDNRPFILTVEPKGRLAATQPAIDRSAGPPPAGPMPTVNFPEFTRHSLKNGLEVVIATQASIPLVEIALIVDAGFAADQHARPGTSSLSLSMLDEGTQSRSALQISEELALVGARLSAASGLDTSTVQLSALRENLNESLELFADVVLYPSFPDDELKRLRRVGLARIQQEKNEPVSQALRVMPRLLYGQGHPYAQPLTGSGTEADLNALTREDLEAFHATWFKPNHATLIAAGDITPDELLPKLEKLFADWEPGETPAKLLAQGTKPTGSTLYVLDRPDAEQSVIFAGQLVPPKNNPDEVAIDALNNIFGGLSSGRINMNLREDKGWAYGAYSFVLDARGRRPWLAYSSVQTDKTTESIAEFKREFAEIASTNAPTAAELATAVRSDTLSLPGRWETLRNVTGALAETVRFGLPDDHWSSYAERVANVALDDVRRTGAELIDADAITWVVIGDREAILPGLKSLGFEQIRDLDADGLQSDNTALLR